MPNWCRNNLTVHHEDPRAILKFAKILESTTGLFESFKPNPSGKWEYSWSLENWGVKWDVNTEDITIVQIDEDRIVIEFDTAWGFPREFYQHLEDLDYEVFAMYHEEGMAFCGIYTDGEEDYYEYGDMSPEEIREIIPEDVNNCFGIAELMEDRLENE